MNINLYTSHVPILRSEANKFEALSLLLLLLLLLLMVCISFCLEDGNLFANFEYRL